MPHEDECYSTVETPGLPYDPLEVLPDVYVLPIVYLKKQAVHSGHAATARQLRSVHYLGLFFPYLQQDTIF